MEFNASPRHTVGVEWELQLLDAVTLDLVDGIVPLMEFFPDTPFIKPEYIQSCVELNTRISQNSEDAVEHLRQLLARVLERCASLEMAVCGAGTHPFGRRLALITPLPRYQRMVKQEGYLGYSQITFSTHVHVGMGSGDEAIHAMGYLTSALPAFVALAGNSPFWRGHDTGHAAYRQRILAATGSYGLPPRFRDWRHFNQFLSAAHKAGMITQLKDIHWDIRPHPDFGTLELRAMDAASDLHTLGGLVAFARSLVVCMANSSADDVRRVLPLELPDWIERENYYRASHQGLGAAFIYDANGNHRPLRDVLLELIDFCAPVAEELGEVEGLKVARGIVTGLAGYQHQREAYELTQSTRAVAKRLTEMLDANQRTVTDHAAIPTKS